MPNEWVVLELSPKAEGEDPDFIRASIRHMVRDAEVYLPVSVTKVGEDRVINYLVDGYAFIKRAHPDDKYYKLEGSRYVQTVITRIDRSAGRPVRKLACVTDADIERFTSQIHKEDDQGIGVGDTIVVTSGPYRQIKAIVIEDIPEKDTVQVHVKLRSKETIVTLPRSFLKLVEKAPRASFLPRLVSLRDWVSKFRYIAFFDDRAIAHVREGLHTYNRLHRMQILQDDIRSGTRLYGSKNFDPRSITTAFGRLGQLDIFNGRLAQLNATIHAAHRKLDSTLLVTLKHSLDILQKGHDIRQELLPIYTRSVSKDALEKAFHGYQTVHKLYDRMLDIENDVRGIQKAHWGDIVTDNVIIDGHNLAIRCAMAPGLDQLKDSKGNPTGGIVGFLRCLGSFHKKWPGAKFTVVWDGSSQRRKKMFVEYKANRSTLRSYFEIEFLKDILPYLGISQAWHPEEEADDVIATLLRGPFRGQQNVIVGTDRDLLQLVTDTDHMYVPAVGAGKERVYDPQSVENEYGVPPNSIIHYRAIDGDTSDNIPGAPGFGPKMASKLIKLYGTVDGVFASSLVGLTPKQYTNLRAAENQVRLNIELMALHTDLPLTLTNPNPDQTVATQRLRNVDVKVDSILPVFFPVLGGGA